MIFLPTFDGGSLNAQSIRRLDLVTTKNLDDGEKYTNVVAHLEDGDTVKLEATEIGEVWDVLCTNYPAHPGFEVVIAEPPYIHVEHIPIIAWEVAYKGYVRPITVKGFEYYSDDNWAVSCPNGSVYNCYGLYYKSLKDWHSHFVDLAKRNKEAKDNYTT